MSPICRSFSLLPAAVLALLSALCGTALLVSWTSPPPPLAVAPAGIPAAGSCFQPAVDSAPANRAAVAADLGCLGAPAGSTFRFRVTDTMTFALHSASGTTQSAGSLRAACEVQTTVLDRRADGILVQQQVVDLQFHDANGQPITGDALAERYTAATASPVLMHFAPSGTVAAFGFATELDGDQRNFLRGTLGLFSIQAPADRETWLVTECDNTGEFAAEYRVGEADVPTLRAVARRRLEYRSIVGQDPTPEHQLRGATRAHFATDLGWIAGISADEGMTIELPLADLQVVSARRAEVVLLGSGSVAIATDLDDAWRRTTANVLSLEPAGHHAAEMETEHWRQRLQGTSVEQVLAELQALLGASPIDDEAVNAAFLQLQWLAKLEPAAIDALRDGVLTGTLPAGTAPTALSALAAAGTEAAQSALVAVREHRSLAADVRMAATVAAVQLDAPSGALMQSLWRDASGGDEVRGSSMLVLGVLSGRNQQVLADGRTSLQALLALENEAIANGDLPTWLLAVGNTGAGEALPIAVRYLEHGDATVRSAACVLLRRVPGLPAVELLATRALGDGEPTVRGEAIRELGRRSEPAARTALERVIAVEADEELRNKARELLAQAR